MEKFHTNRRIRPIRQIADPYDRSSTRKVSGIWKMLTGPLNGQDNWAGPGGMGPQRGQGNWRAVVHDDNFNANGTTIGSYFNPSLSPATAKALI